jgi:hypothetical protein
MSDTMNEILRTLGRIEGQLINLNKLSERVAKLELWQNWLRGAWTALAGALAYVYRISVKTLILAILLACVPRYAGHPGANRTATGQLTESARPPPGSVAWSTR